ncbi:zinc finger protein 2 [Diachasma alloeum]|uniref:zinc finger protein 2 n=1 Tax=Diachasma alloeum TaxID=454923 RepID=UPI0007383853|nr:zinc finger protein 2 [Diachasma alloeum]
MLDTIAHSSPAEYRVVVVCKPSGEKTTSLILGDKEIARNIPLMLPTKDPLCTREQMMEATVECPICHRKFADRAAVDKHTSSAHKSAYKCKHCDTCFFTQQALDQHMATHKHPLVFPCPQCKKKYKRRDGLNLHIVRAHSKIEAKFTCDDCDKLFQLKADLLAHMSRAHMLQECRFCHKIVKDLKNHEDAHKKKNADIIDENCDLCGQRFRSKARYDTHRKKHKDGRNLECKECGLVFPGHRALINHRDREHRSGTTCEICKKVFYSITNYYQHVLVHAGIKPYKCDVCSENFSQRTSLKRHRERHEGPLPPFDEVTRIAHLAKEYLDTL